MLIDVNFFVLIKLPNEFFYTIIYLGEVNMDFFRQNKKLIVGIIAMCFILWTVGMGLLLILPSLGG